MVSANSCLHHGRGGWWYIGPKSASHSLFPCDETERVGNDILDFLHQMSSNGLGAVRAPGTQRTRYLTYTLKVALDIGYSIVPTYLPATYYLH
jgi:hypothetical protein